VQVALFNEKESASAQRCTVSIDDGHPSSSNNEQPLVTAAMAIFGVALSVARRKHHLRRLRSAIA
jgi:hypothetical protein